MWRSELKYLITLAQYQDIQKRIRPYVVLDSQCRNGEPYLINSTYFDTPDYYHYWQKREGAPLRKKYRFRTYGEEQEKGYFEIKYRHYSSVAKQRTPIQKKQWSSILLNPSVLPSDSLAAEMLYHTFTIQELRPTHLVQYKRLAYIVQHDFPYRITFDFELSGINVTNHVWRGTCKRNLFEGCVIMELKPHRHLPLWNYHLLKERGLVTQAISKYAFTLEKIGIL